MSFLSPADRSSTPERAGPAAAEDGGAGGVTDLAEDTARAPTDAAPEAAEPEAVEPGPARHPVRTGLAWLLTALALVFLLVALLVPAELAQVSPGAFVRLPIEAVIGLAVLLVLPPRARRIVGPLLGLLLGALFILRLIDIGFLAVLDRPFNMMVDWGQLGDALNVLRDSIGEAGTTAATVGALVLAALVLVALPLAVHRLTRLAGRHRPAALRTVAVLAPLWLVCALLGVQVVPGVAVASGNAAGMLADRGTQVVRSIEDSYVFADQIAVDAYRDVPGDQLLTALRGKDVLFAFVESYGRSAIENPEYAEVLGPVLDQDTQRLAAAGFGARTGYLTSSTTGGNSWLAHAALMSGLWTNDQQRYNQVTKTDRLTLNKAFGKAGWRTVGVMPGITKDWPEGRFFGYQHLYDKPALDYHGPNFGWGPIPDQFTMARLHQGEFSSPDHPPVMAEIALVSSHWPWAPLPRMVGWDDLGDGSVFNPQIAEGLTYDEVWQDESRVRAEYRRSLEYSLETLVSYVETYGDDDTVMVMLGDHQPAPNVTGEGASRDVPITILARDPAVLDRIAGWGWNDGLTPAPDSPVWPMDAFRDRFLAAFGPDGQAPR